MTKYILKKETFGIPAGTIAEEHDGCCYVLDYFEAGDRIERSVYLPNRLLENDHYFEKVEEPKKLARAAYIFENGRTVITDTAIPSLSAAISQGELYTNAVARTIWPARFDEDGYLIMEVER